MWQGNQVECQVKLTPFKIYLLKPNPLKWTGDFLDPSDRVRADKKKSNRRLTWKTTIRCSMLAVFITTLLIIQDSMTHLHTFMVSKESVFW